MTPRQAQAVPRVGDYQRLDVERILTLKPDLVLAWLSGNTSRELQQLEAAGVPMFYLEPRRLAALASFGSFLYHRSWKVALVVPLLAVGVLIVGGLIFAIYYASAMGHFRD